MFSLPIARRTLPVVLIAGLAACSGAQTTAGLVPSAPTASSHVAAAEVPATQVPAAQVPATSPLMFTANRDGKPYHEGGLLAFRMTADGNVKPEVNISGSNTTLYNPDSLAIDKADNIYAADDGGTQVAVFASSAHGNVAPARVIGGSNSNLGPTEGLTINAYGELLVSSYSNNDITEYEAHAKGNVTPINTIGGSNTQLNSPAGMVIDPNGDLFVANTWGASITVYAGNAKGNATPIRVIQGSFTALSAPFALALDQNGRLLVADENSGVLVFAKGANGNVAPLAQITSVSSADGVMADSNNNIYVADWGHKAIEEFASNANGYATPIRSIKGSRTGFNGPNFLSLK
ncbi:MAG TPA: NHL repeat-containing protein [Candidatus Nitrosotalea sp.]|nr:NHL repeat-containing protein [Candidatus Nitrosotalea sp.]